MLSLSGRMGDIYFQLLEKYLNYLLVSHEYIKDIQVTIARRFHLFPFRTEKLSFVTPMVLRTSGRVGSRRFSFPGPFRVGDFFCLLVMPFPLLFRSRPFSGPALPCSSSSFVMSDSCMSLFCISRIILSVCKEEKPEYVLLYS